MDRFFRNEYLNLYPMLKACESQDQPDDCKQKIIIITLPFAPDTVQQYTQDSLRPVSDFEPSLIGTALGKQNITDFEREAQGEMRDIIERYNKECR